MGGTGVGTGTGTGVGVGGGGIVGHERVVRDEALERLERLERAVGTPQRPRRLPPRRRD